MTETEIEQDAGGNSIVLCRQVDDNAERQDKDSEERGVLLSGRNVKPSLPMI